MSFKKYFEANLLDGEPLNVAYLNALDVYEVMAEYVSQLEQRVLEARPENLKFKHVEVVVPPGFRSSQQDIDDAKAAYYNGYNAGLDDYSTNLKGMFGDQKDA